MRISPVKSMYVVTSNRWFSRVRFNSPTNGPIFIDKGHEEIFGRFGGPDFFGNDTQTSRRYGSSLLFEIGFSSQWNHATGSSRGKHGGTRRGGIHGRQRNHVGGRSRRGRQDGNGNWIGQWHAIESHRIRIDIVNAKIRG